MQAYPRSLLQAGSVRLPACSHGPWLMGNVAETRCDEITKAHLNRLRDAHSVPRF
jgi:hypothetical protein